jgi:hypothetical protein
MLLSHIALLLFFAIVFLCFAIFTFRRSTRRYERFGVLLVGIGGLAFIGPGTGLTAAAPDWLELPNSINASWVKLMDGRVVVANEPLSRLQVYASDGGFLRGVAMPSAGGSVSLRAEGASQVSICAARGGQKTIFDSAGDVISSGSSCEFRNDPSSGSAPVRPGWRATLLVPLWHPIIAWLTCVVGLLLNARQLPGHWLSYRPTRC